MKPSTPLLCIAFYCSRDGKDQWWESAWKAVNQVAMIAQHPITHCEVTMASGNSPRKPWKMIERNVARIQSLLESGECRAFDVYSVGPNCDYMQSPLVISTSLDVLGRELGVITMQLQPRCAGGYQENYNMCQEIVTEINCRLDPHQALIHCMRAHHYPTLYFHDALLSAQLDSDQEENVRSWRAYHTRFDEVMRGVYWANLISDGHWRHSGQLRRSLIEGLVRTGAEVHEFADKKVLFNLRIDPLRLYEHRSEFAQYESNVRGVLAMHDVGVVTTVTV